MIMEHDLDFSVSATEVEGDGSISNTHWVARSSEHAAQSFVDQYMLGNRYGSPEGESWDISVRWGPPTPSRNAWEGYIVYRYKLISIMRGERLSVIQYLPGFHDQE